MSEGLFDRLFGDAAAESPFRGVCIGVVTNVKDPDGLGRVKVKLPWVTDLFETGWARVASPAAGAGRGFFFLPEVNDEVLVAFLNGDPGFPFVIGALWNGRDKPPVSNSDGKNDVREIRSRSGHVIRLVDTKGGERIEIADSSGKNTITVATKDNSVAIAADGNISLTSAKGKVTISGQDVEITAKAGLTAKANQKATVQGQAGLDLKGSTVNIN